MLFHIPSKLCGRGCGFSVVSSLPRDCRQISAESNLVMGALSVSVCLRLGIEVGA